MLFHRRYKRLPLLVRHSLLLYLLFLYSYFLLVCSLLAVLPCLRFLLGSNLRSCMYMVSPMGSCQVVLLLRPRGLGIFKVRINRLFFHLAPFLGLLIVLTLLMLNSNCRRSLLWGSLLRLLCTFLTINQKRLDVSLSSLLVSSRLMLPVRLLRRKHRKNYCIRLFRVTLLLLPSLLYCRLRMLFHFLLHLYLPLVSQSQRPQLYWFRYCLRLHSIMRLPLLCILRRLSQLFLDIIDLPYLLLVL